MHFKHRFSHFDIQTTKMSNFCAAVCRANTDLAATVVTSKSKRAFNNIAIGTNPSPGTSTHPYTHSRKVRVRGVSTDMSLLALHILKVLHDLHSSPSIPLMWFPSQITRLSKKMLRHCWYNRRHKIQLQLMWKQFLLLQIKKITW